MNEAITSFPFCSQGLVPGIFSRALEIDSVDEKATTGEEKIFLHKTRATIDRCRGDLSTTGTGPSVHIDG